MSDQLTRADCMTGFQASQMGDSPRTHENCIAHTGVARPGKTRHDKARGVWMPKHVRRDRQIQKQAETQTRRR